MEREIAAYIPQVKRTVEGAVAYVKISDGCNRFCSFCMIPYIRGRYHSRNVESIISEVRDLVAGGVREIVLIGREAGSGTRDGFESIVDVKDSCKYAQDLTATGAASVQQDAGYTGAGSRIAVVDTGTDTDHQSFSAAGFDYSLQKQAEQAGKTVEDYNLLDTAEIASVLSQLHVSSGVTANQLYLNTKLPFGYNYVDKDLSLIHI